MSTKHGNNRIVDSLRTGHHFIIMKKITINATGCCLVDTILNGVDFESSAIKSYLSVNNGDGGLNPGELVFREKLEEYAGCSVDYIVDQLIDDHVSVEKNIGGPAIVALICVAQILMEMNVSFRFFQFHGDDENGEYIRRLLRDNVPQIDTSRYSAVKGATAETLVLSDPRFDGGKGERTFVNTIGTAGLFTPESLGEDFFEGEILVFGATALTPAIHKELTSLLRRGREQGKINIVTTVFDFFSESRNPDRPWPLGEGESSYPLIDLLITDYVEALRLSGTDSLHKAAEQFLSWGLPALVVTNGAEEVTYYATADSVLFEPSHPDTLPVLDLNDSRFYDDLAVSGDTTGCGDNFAGGVISHIAGALSKGDLPVSIGEAVRLGICTGASACFHLGGMWREKIPGEKKNVIDKLLSLYKVGL